jgi:hypothetical protein
MATTTNYGWTTPDNTGLVKDGAANIRTLGSAVDSTLGTALNSKTQAGLVLIKSQVITGTPSSVSVTSVFSTSYASYRVVLDDIDVTVSTDLFLKFNNSAGSTYSQYLYTADYGVAGSATQQRNNNTSNGVDLGYPQSASNTSWFFDINQAFSAKNTTVSFMGSNGTFSFHGNGNDSNAASQTGFSLTVPSGTFTAGNIYVYGYGKA